MIDLAEPSQVAPWPLRWRRWGGKSAARRRRDQRRRRRAYREAERAAGTHGARYMGSAGPDVLTDPWSLRDVPPWAGEEG